MEITHCVIGSGPAGVACATALLARGARVLLLDAGGELEPEVARVIRPLAEKPPGQFTARDLQNLRGNPLPTAQGLPRKLIFGSDFPYRGTETEIPWRSGNTGLEPSLALGGFSNVWGAAMLPFRDADLAGWPVKNAELAPHYRAVTAITGLAAQRDDLAESLPLYCEAPQPLPSSRQAEWLLGNLNRHREPLRAAGWRFGRARLAVRAATTAAGGGCRLCGLCLTGCPYGCIFNSADTVRQLQTRPDFTYQREAIVTRLGETGGRVEVRGFDRRTREPLRLQAERVYLASGVIPTAQILLRSQGDYDRPVRLRDSQYFLFPLLLSRRLPGLPAEALHTLSQVFLEVDDPAVSAHPIHLQAYSYSDTIHQAVRQSLGPLKALAPRLAERLLVFQGYLHSDESATITMTLYREGAKDVLQLQAEANPETRPRIHKLLRALLRQSHRLGGMVVPPWLQVPQPGRGFHSGGSWAMRTIPGRFESDVLGRPHGWSRVHVVDASVLPSIPATTITFSVMANAHRIGWETAGA